MTMVAGCALPSGVIIAADTRVTFYRADGTISSRKDQGLKVFAAPHTIIGFAGDCRLAGHLLREAETALGDPSLNLRNDPVSISLWLPPFLKYHYDELRRKANPAWAPPLGIVAFLVGSALSPSLGGKEETIEAIFSTDDDEPASMPMGGPRVGLPWGAADAREWTECAGARNILYTLRSEMGFEPRVFRPLQFAAIGTGQDVRETLHRAPLSIYTAGFAEHFMDEYMRNFRVREGLIDCGGLNPMLEVSSRGPEARPSEKTIVFRGGRQLRIGLVHEGGKWSQRNYTTGRRVDLMAPWLLNDSPPDELFDDLEEAIAAQRRGAA